MRAPFLRGLLSALSISLPALLLPLQAWAAKPYDYAVVGNPADVTRPKPALPALVLMGGGPDVDDAFKWMIQKSGGGNFVILRARGTDAYNPYVYAMGGVSSVETIVIPSREAASDPFVIARIQGAEALFIAGGDQSDYVKFWKGTPVQTAIEALATRNIPIGGTSAGLSVMSKFSFTALNGSITSDAALANPFSKDITLGRDFLSLPDMGGLIADPHLDARDRMGRLVTFMARIVNDGWASGVHGVGVDVETALLVEGGNATRVGAGSAYFLRTVGLPEVCKPKTPLTYRNITTQRLSGSGVFDMRNWASYDGGTVNYSISAVNGVLTSTQPGGSVY
ncbi:cyanophycinase [Pseudoduganella sp. UC29_71]|jgi:cyanophycinase|uniref:cyanophycinase n=1 Tax=Pseudoduganella sp. UC29_71 TaxID=3350174 RepID=UPI003671675F